MRHYNAHQSEDGFSLLELIIIMVFVGILSAVSVPSFLAANQKNQVTNDLNSAKSALTEAQRGAMRRGADCQLDFDYSANNVTPPTISSTSSNCLSTGIRILDNVSMRVSTNNTSLSVLTSANTSSLTFDYLGNLSGTTLITIVLRQKSDTGSSSQQCLVISQPLGLIASGKYTGTSTTDIASNCTP
jgi:Tfp pilus assembly protein FimT